LIAALDGGLCFPTIVCPSSIIDAGSGLASSIAGPLASSLMSEVGAGVQQAATWLVQQVFTVIEQSTTPEVTGSWFVPQLQLMEQVAGLVILPVLMVATIGPVLRQDGRRLARVWGIGLPVAVFAGFAASELTQLAIQATDYLSEAVVGPSPDALAQAFVHAATSPAVEAAPLFVQMLLAAVTVAGAMAIWLELTLRSAGVYLATFFMPLVLVAYVWPSTAELARRGVQILASLVLSKFVIVASLGLGFVALTSGSAEAAVSGAAILLMAAFAPFALLRLAPVAEASVIAHLEGMSRRPIRAAARTVTAAAAAPVHPVTQMVMSTVSRAKSGPSGGLVSTPVSAQPITDRPPDYVVRSGSGSGSSHD
jgi:hypothetical protein